MVEFCILVSLIQPTNLKLPIKVHFHGSFDNRPKNGTPKTSIFSHKNHELVPFPDYIHVWLLSQERSVNLHP